MSTFTLDTSGEVRGAGLIEQPDGNWRSHWMWSDLSPFVQGWVEAMLCDATAHDHVERQQQGRERSRFDRDLGFSDLASETLAAILKDCEAYRAVMRGEPDRGDFGARMWTDQQAGGLVAYGFPPVTPYLGDDGKVYLREAK